jgi:hypothetical protein
MTYAEAIGAGFRLVHRNWQLVLIQLLMSVLGCVAFLVIIGVPLVLALIMLGMDIAQLASFRDLLGTLSDPGEIIDRYLGIVVMAALSLLIYALFAFSLWAYVAGGSAGVIKGSIKDPGAGFTLKGFFSEARGLFFPIAGYAALMGTVFVGIVFALGVMGGALASGLTALSGGTALELFLKVFSALLFITAGVVVLSVLGSVALTGFVAVVLEGTGPLRAIAAASRHLNSHPGALGLYAVVFTGYIALDLLLALAGYPFTLIPLVGVFLSLPYRLVSYVIQGYFCLVMLSTVLAHYWALTSGGSTQPSGTSREGAPPQGPPPYRSAGPR